MIPQRTLRPCSLLLPSHLVVVVAVAPRIRLSVDRVEVEAMTADVVAKVMAAEVVAAEDLPALTPPLVHPAPHLQ